MYFTTWLIPFQGGTVGEVRKKPPEEINMLIARVLWYYHIIEMLTKERRQMW